MQAATPTTACGTWYMQTQARMFTGRYTVGAIQYHLEHLQASQSPCNIQGRGITCARCSKAEASTYTLTVRPLRAHPKAVSRWEAIFRTCFTRTCTLDNQNRIWHGTAGFQRSACTRRHYQQPKCTPSRPTRPSAPFR